MVSRNDSNNKNLVLSQEHAMSIDTRERKAVILARVPFARGLTDKLYEHSNVCVA